MKGSISAEIQPSVKCCKHNLSLRRKFYCRNNLFTGSYSPSINLQEKEGFLLLTLSQNGTTICRMVPAPIFEGIQLQKFPWGWADAKQRGPLSTCISIVLESLTWWEGMGRVRWQCWAELHGSPCLLGIGLRKREFHIPPLLYASSALCPNTWASYEYSLEQAFHSRANLEAVLQLILTGISNLITIFHVTVTEISPWPFLSSIHNKEDLSSGSCHYFSQ